MINGTSRNLQGNMTTGGMMPPKPRVQSFHEEELKDAVAFKNLYQDVQNATKIMNMPSYNYPNGGNTEMPTNGILSN